VLVFDEYVSDMGWCGDRLVPLLDWPGVTDLLLLAFRGWKSDKGYMCSEKCMSSCPLHR
jgi:hypothetical protein